MADIERSKFVKAGAWRTLESTWGSSFSCRFWAPAGAKVKVRYGGWIFGWNGQQKTLDEINLKLLSVGGGSIAYARVQMSVSQDAQVIYTYIAANS